FMNSSSDPLGKSTSGSPPGSAPAGAPSASPHAANGPEGNGSSVDEFGLDSTPSVDTTPSLTTTIKTILVGKPRDLADTSIYHHLSLVAFLAWVGLGADGLSSSCYGPAEAFAMLKEGGDFRFLAIFLALATAITVFVISACYSHILEAFPSGGGGYLVASKLLGPKVGVISGCALLVDYALTITTSIAAAGDALFGLLSPEFHIGHFTHHQCLMAFESLAVVGLIILNLRGIKESVTFLLPIFIVFLITHIILIAGALILNMGNAGAVVDMVGDGLRKGIESPEIGPLALLMIFLHSYSMGAGTYTGIEAVSNSMPVMREPRVQTGQRTMRLMAISLALTAGGLMVAYLLLNLDPTANNGKTMNTVLSEIFAEELHLPGWLGSGFVLITIVSEGCLLLVAAQAGFIDGPRVLANMARDSWMPHWFGNLSERLSVHNGVALMGFAALAALWFTGGQVTTLLVMYSINVFVTFSLSMIGMCRHWWELRNEGPIWKRRFALFLFGATMCVGILIGNVIEKAEEGGWVTIMVTSTLVIISLMIHRYYSTVFERLQRLNSLLGIVTPPGAPTAGEPSAHDPVAAVLVGGYSGLGVHTMLNALRFGPGQFKGLVFLSVGIVDSGNFKGADAVEDLRAHTEASLNKYVDHARRLGMPAIGFMSIGTDPVDELERLCVEVQKRYARAIFFAGRLVFQKDTWYQRLLHNETAYSLQRRLQWDGVPMVILPTRVR
ncbi:MAG TPA: APC family permease, partial [Pirellulales bacterium]|nr:APC family permease [Pirellulales bacterium]